MRREVVVVLAQQSTNEKVMYETDVYVSTAIFELMASVDDDNALLRKLMLPRQYRFQLQCRKSFQTEATIEGIPMKRKAVILCCVTMLGLKVHNTGWRETHKIGGDTRKFTMLH